MLITLAALAFFVAALLIAAANDIATMTIPNWVSIALVVAFPVFALSFGYTVGDVAWHLFVGFVVLLLGIGLFSLNLLGGGDVKVIAAIAVWTGLAGFATFVAATAFAGAGLSIAILIARRIAAPSESRPAFLNRLLDKARGAPYAIAILAGGLYAIPALPFPIATALSLVSLTSL
jgi:prepilin peptidase CpaA